MKYYSLRDITKKRRKVQKPSFFKSGHVFASTLQEAQMGKVKMTAYDKKAVIKHCTHCESCRKIWSPIQKKLKGGFC